MTLRALADFAIARLFAPPCAACGRPVTTPLDGAICEACWAGIRLFTPPLCVACGVPLPSWRAASLSAIRCARCRRGRRALDRQAAIGPYEGVLRDILHALKYEGRRSAARPLSRRMRQSGREILEDAAVAVPVPLHWHRRWARGFNQADLLAAGLGLPVARLLCRTRATPPQVSLPAAARHRNVRAAFRLSGRIARPGAGAERQLDGLVVVLVDDVSTTGATLEACARVLKGAGAREVRAVTAARVVTERPR